MSGEESSGNYEGQAAVSRTRKYQDDDHENIYDDDPNSPLNPHSDKFDGRAWVKAFARGARQRGQRFRQLGLCFQNLSVFGYNTPTDFQKDVGSVWLALPDMISRLFFRAAGQARVDILHQFDGLILPGEMCIVLGPPGSGCSTLLKTLAGETNGIYVDDGSYLNYHGMSANEVHTAHRGDAMYTADVDVHFPELTIGETLTFASRARCQKQLPPGIDRDRYCDYLRDVVMAMYGIKDTVNTKVGNEFVRGVSGGQRKRVTIAEATLANAPFQCWDNSTRGLDSANAIEFCRTLKNQSESFGQTSVVSIYQAPQHAYDLFDKATVIYEGRQIYFGPASKAREYFINLGFECPARQTTPDFLTSMTSSAERVPITNRNPPRTPNDFATAWKNSQEYIALQADIKQYKSLYPPGSPDAEIFRQLKRSTQADGQREKSPYTLTYAQQVLLCLWRAVRRFLAEPWVVIGTLIGNMAFALIVSSLFYNIQSNTSSFYSRACVLFVGVLSNAFASALEITTLYDQRPIVEKQSRYAFYHRSAEAMASVLMDIPFKILNAIAFNLVFYFMTNLNRHPGPFFFYLLVVFLMVLAMSGLFRSIASLSRTPYQAMIPAAILMLALIIFTGFVIPTDYMLGWCRWIKYLNPVAYGFESLMANEFHGRNFTCSTYVPNYATADAGHAVCSAVSAVAGQSYVNGDAYIQTAYGYFDAHRWRNVGVIIAMIVFNHVVHFASSEYITEKRSKGEVLVFRRGARTPAAARGAAAGDVEKASPSSPAPAVEGYHTSSSSDRAAGGFQGSVSVFHWNDVCYDIKVKGGQQRRVLNNVDGWVKPGTLTALMGVSGAGKTTLLDCLADRVAGRGIITGEICVDGKHRDEKFQRQTGYAQQQDLHLATSTVREALEFSALLRQSADTPRSEKLAYVYEVIKLLDMEEYADAVVGVPGEGLNVEQRKRLTIGVELAAKPPHLLFVDEPTSGLDSQTSWAVLDLLEKLTKAGQSVICTIHQPSAVLFQRFDRLLFLNGNGFPVYFGDIGKNSNTLSEYLTRNGAPECPEGANPAEWMFEAIGDAPGTSSEVDWHQVWRSSPEYEAIQHELSRLGALAVSSPCTDATESEKKKSYSIHDESAVPLWEQFLVVTQRVFQQHWRTPSYIYSKLILCIAVSLFVGLVFLDAPLTIQGLQNQMFAIFEFCSIFGQLAQQQMPHFVTQRSLYEARERPAKTYSWVVFMLSQIAAEIPWSTVASVFMWALIYYPVGFYRNADATGQGAERGGLMWLLFWQFLLFANTFTAACVSFADSAEAGSSLANLLFMLIFFFCGVLVSSDALPRVWIFLYRVSPLSYWVSAVLSTGVANVEVNCASNEWLSFSPPDGETCGAYMAEYIQAAGGYLMDPNSTGICEYCTMRETNVFLDSIGSHYDTRWRGFGIVWVYIVFNAVAACGLYYLFRVPRAK